VSFVKTRTAKEQDCAAMVPLFEQWGHAQTELQVSAVLGLWSSTPLGEILLADDHGTVAGMAAVAASPRFADFGRNATLAGLVVADAYRRRGVGTMLLTAVETTARSWGCVRLELTSSRSRTAAHDLYLAFGFEETSERQARYVRALDQQVADLELG